MSVTQMFHNYMMTTKKNALFVLSPAGFGLNMGTGWLFQVTEPWSKTVNYAVDVMYKPQDTGRRNRVCLEFVWEQMKK